MKEAKPPRFSPSLRSLLLVALVSLQAFAVLTTVFLISLGTERALIKQSVQLLEEAGARVGNEVSSFLEPARQAVELSVDLLEKGALDVSDDDALESHLFRLLQIAPQQAGLFVGRPDGSFVYVSRGNEPGQFRTKTIRASETGAQLVWRDGSFSVLRRATDPADTYDPRTRPWYNAAELGRGSVWTDPYVFFTSQRPGLTVANPVYDGPDLIAVVGADIEIEVLSLLLSDVRDTDAGATMILTDTNRIIAHSRGSVHSSHEPFLALSNDIDAIAFDAFGTADGTGIGPHLFDDKITSLIAIKDVDLGWRIGLHAPQEAFTGEIRSDRKRWMWIVLIVVLLSSIIAFVIADRIGRPVVAFALASGRIARGDVGPAQLLRAPYKELTGASEVLVKEIGKRRRFQAAYDRTFEVSSRGMARIDPQTGRLVHVNDRLCEQFGQAKDALLSLRLEDITAHDDRGQISVFFDAMKADRECSLDIRLQTQTDTLRWTRLTAILIRDEAGAPDHALAIFDDVEEERVAQADIERLSRDLAHVGRVNAMGELAGGLAHELNQPLAAMIHDIDTARLILDQNDSAPDELFEVLQDVESHAMRAGDIIRALRDLVRKEKGRRVAFDMSALIQQTVTLLETEARDLGVTISFDPMPSSVATGNRTQIAQVLVNLMRNSFAAFERIETSHRQVTIRQANNGNSIETSIQDNGPGLPVDLKPFSKFITTTEAGLGLGLSICQTLMHANEGTIRHEAVSPHGAKFVLTLPDATSPTKEVNQ
jgi:PAS domain S-box-containing protein